MFPLTSAALRERFAREAALPALGEEPFGRAFGRGMAGAIARICVRPFYLHHELFAESYAAAARDLGAELAPQAAARLADFFWTESMARFRELGAAALRPDALATLGGLRDRGYRLGLVSNIDEREFQAFLALPGFADHFDVALSSEAAGSCKPDPGIFHRALAAVDCPAREAVYVGDTPAHDVEGAAAVGMRTVLIRDAHTLIPTRDLGTAVVPDWEVRELTELLALFPQARGSQFTT
jgi:HAD superfamily hydrolase (TIGR01509 family)